jgi:hypothetical protein
VFNIFLWTLAEASVVEKANKCLDFTLTVFVIHLVIMSISHGVPSLTPLSWWLIHAAIITVATLCSEAVCMKLETQEIKLSVNDILDSGK